MEKRIKGKCKYCGKEYTLSYMKKHLNFLCDDCCKTHKRGEYILINISSSPRKKRGGCGYCGSKIFPDQFMSDVEECGS